MLLFGFVNTHVRVSRSNRTPVRLETIAVDYLKQVCNTFLALLLHNWTVYGR